MEISTHELKWSFWNNSSKSTVLLCDVSATVNCWLRRDGTVEISGIRWFGTHDLNFGFHIFTALLIAKGRWPDRWFGRWPWRQNVNRHGCDRSAWTCDKSPEKSAAYAEKHNRSSSSWAQAVSPFSRTKTLDSLNLRILHVPSWSIVSQSGKL